jgi:DNA-binding NtrC family response regulator
MTVTRQPAHPILVVDDEVDILFAIDTTLQMAGFNHVVTCQDSRKVMELLGGQPFELVLLDLTMPHLDGENLLPMIAQEFPEVPVLIVTGTLDVETAVQCMKAGAFDYVVKPVEEERLMAAIQRAMAFRRLTAENRALKEHMLSKALDHPEAFADIVTGNTRMLAIFQYIESIAPTSQGVLIRGETGVGKELVARALHRASNVAGPFVAVNVAGLDDNVFSDTLFGHAKGAFTGADRVRPGLIEQAAGGTLFLDEIGDLNPASQVKLLRLLQEGEYLPLGEDRVRQTDARVVTSTNADLWQMVEEGTFRKDLNYRLRTHQVRLPPLRERMDDIAALSEHFLQLAATDLKKTKPSAPPELITLLQTYRFPGNIRELQSMVFDAVSRHKSGRLSLDPFRSHIKRQQDRESISSGAAPRSEGDPAAPITFGEQLPTLKEAAQLLVEEAMQRAHGNQTIAAGLLGISQQALSKRLKNIKPDRSM